MRSLHTTSERVKRASVFTPHTLLQQFKSDLHTSREQVKPPMAILPFGQCRVRAYPHLTPTLHYHSLYLTSIKFFCCLLQTELGVFFNHSTYLSINFNRSSKLRILSSLSSSRLNFNLATPVWFLHLPDQFQDLQLYQLI